MQVEVQKQVSNNPIFLSLKLITEQQPGLTRQTAKQQLASNIF